MGIPPEHHAQSRHALSLTVQPNACLGYWLCVDELDNSKGLFELSHGLKLGFGFRLLGPNPYK